MNLYKLIKCTALLFVLSSSCYAMSLNYVSGGSEGAASLSNSYSLDASTSLSDEVAIEDGGMRQDQSVSGSGANSISRTAGNDRQSISSNAYSKSGLNSNAITYAAGADLSFSQSVSALGESKVGVYTSTGALSASQSAGVVSGAMASLQKATAQDGAVAAYQASAIDGAMGFADGSSATPKESAKVSGGLNGLGFMGGQMVTFASSSANALANMHAVSDASKAYSTAEATTDEKNAYSYLSSSSQLASSMAARTGSEPSADQDMAADGDVLAYASSNDGGDAKNVAWESPSTSGHLSAKAGITPSADDLSGDVQSTSANLRPVPGHTVWQGLGGYTISDPSLIKDNQGRVHAFVQGGDTSLYDNINGNWYGLGQSLTSDPFAIKDQQGRIHTFARSQNGNLIDNVFNTAAFTQYWQNLGGYITSDPAAALEPVTNGFLKIVARGGDGSLIMRDLDTRSMTGTWSNLGGYINGDPYDIFDAQKNIHVFARGGDNSLWDNYGVWNGAVYVQSWKYLGGSLSSDARPIQDPNNFNILHVFGRNSADGQLVDTRVLTSSGAFDRVFLGGFISPAGAGSAIYEGNPEPLADADRLIHNFVRGGDGSLWDNVYDTSVGTTAWYPMGGYITSDASATLDASNLIKVGARGGDGSLWINTVF
ncbi:MAG TPA: hypothetical protein VN455_07330 [Methanotrichaceae archaeon]|nr:hypothetical protein [Methanotrichaceae archaeon]